MLWCSAPPTTCMLSGPLLAPIALCATLLLAYAAYAYSVPDTPGYTDENSASYTV